MNASSKTTAINAELSAIATLRAEALVEAIRDTKGKIFNVMFVKKDGTLRDMTCRVGVKKHASGTQPEISATRKKTLNGKQMVTVYDMSKKGYRVINTHSLVHFKCGEIELDYQK